MAATPSRATRRSARAADSPPLAEAPAAVFSAEGTDTPKSTGRRRAASAAKPKNGGKAAEAPSSSRRSAILLPLLALAFAAAGVLYARYGAPAGEFTWPPRKQQRREPLMPGSETPPPRMQQRREPLETAGKAATPRKQQRHERLAADDLEPIPQPVPPLPPLPPITREEEEAFEAATAAHYAPESPAAAAALRAMLRREEAQEQRPGTGPEAAAAAAATFDAAVHQQYLDLPAWPTPSEEDITGSWNLTEAIYDYAVHLPMAQVLSWHEPRVAVFPSFLTPEEVGHLVGVSADHLERSEVLVAEGEETQSHTRTSSGFWPQQDEVTRRVSERIHRMLGIPEPFGEGMYVLNYQIDQKYDAHNDHCMDGYLGNQVAEPACLDYLKRAGGPRCGPAQGGATCGDRVATFIIYLKSPIRGGQTAFPEAKATKDAMGQDHRHGTDPNQWYCHEPRVLAAAPPAGTGVLFWNYRPSNGTGTGSYRDGSADPLARPVYAALHSGCPVEEGEKYIMTRWIRGAGFDYPRPGPIDD